MQKGLSLLIIPIIIVVLVLIGGAFFLGYEYSKKLTKKTIPLSTIKDTLDWSTFEDEAVGIKFKYPNWWIQNSKAENSQINRVDFVQNGVTVLRYHVVDSNEGKVALDSIKIKVKDREAFKTDSTLTFNLGVEKQLFIMFEEPSKSFQDEIIKTIEFSGRDLIEPYESWKEYHDQINGYKFKYPSILTLKKSDDASQKVNLTHGQKFILEAEFIQTDQELDVLFAAEDVEKVKKILNKDFIDTPAFNSQDFKGKKAIETRSNYNDDMGQNQVWILYFKLKNGILRLTSLYDKELEGFKPHKPDTLNLIVYRISFD